MTREDIIQKMQGAGLKAPARGDFIFIHWDQIAMLLDHERAAEREACAKVCEDNEVCIHLKGGKSLHPRFKDNGSGCDGDVYAAAIRARGQA